MPGTQGRQKLEGLSSQTGLCCQDGPSALQVSLHLPSCPQELPCSHTARAGRGVTVAGYTAMGTGRFLES